MKRKCTILSMTLFMCVGILIIGKQITENQRIYINEVRSWDADIKRDGYYGSDYIEIYNASKKDISLDGWYISDDKSNLKKDQIFEVTVPAKGFAVLYANGKKNSGDSLNFKINPEGEEIFLSDGEGNLVDSIYVPKQEFGTVYARVSDGGNQWGIQESTIAASNQGAKQYPTRNLESPVFSHESGFYEDSFVLTLDAKKGETIYYTLDGSVPTEKSIVYENGILIENRSEEPNIINSVRNIRPDWQTYGPDETPVDKATIVRAIVMNENNSASEVVTKTYFVGLEEYENQNVISIVAEFDDLFGDDGIFVTGKEYDEAYLSGNYDESIMPNILKKGRKWEINGNIQFFQEKEELLNQGIGLRIKGASSRVSKKKRIGVYARKEYSGTPYIRGLNLEGEEAHSLLIQTESPNAILGEMVKDRSLEIQNGNQAVVFINGEYYYAGYLTELYNKYYFQDRCGVDSNNLMVIKNDETEIGLNDTILMYQKMVNDIKMTDLSVEENYENLMTQMDMQSFIDYICVNAYICNMDVAEHKNYMAWRTIEPDDTEKGDARWRWMLYDIDSIAGIHHDGDYGVSRKSQVNSFAEIMDTTGIALNKHPIFEAAKANENFCKQFVLSFMDIANVNFSEENVEKMLKKWGKTLDEYEGFFKERFDYIVPYMAEEFELAGSLENVTLKVNDPSGGTIQLNTTVPDLSQGSWTGKYYTDYPISVTAIPTEGYRFVGWQGSAASEKMTLEAEVEVGGITLEAVFEKNN